MDLDGRENIRELSPADLRGILKYVPQWRNHTFVIALDGAVTESDTFANLLLELAVLRNLGIRLLLVFGIGAQLESLARQNHTKLSDVHGYGPTDKTTLDLAVQAAARVGHRLEQGLTQNQLRCVRTNAVRATDVGILRGTDQLFTGKPDKIDTALLRNLMQQELVPMVAPVCFTRDGSERRLNSDALASELAVALGASKLIFLLPHPGLTYEGELRLNADVSEVRKVLDKQPQCIDPAVRSKARFAVQTIERGVPRAHIIDCRIHDGLLMEVFSKVGIGSMIHSNPYSRIRQARRKDAATIHSLTRSAVRDDSLRPRTRQSIEADIAEYKVYEIDESVIGCFRLTPYPRSATVELGSVYVHPAYKGRHIGKALVDFALKEAASMGKKRVVALTTQSSPFFEQTCGFLPAKPAQLPKPLRQLLERSGRQSRIFLREITPDRSLSKKRGSGRQ